MNRYVIITFLLFALFFKTSFSQDTTNITRTKNNDKVQIAYVVFEKDTLFTIHSSLGPFTPQERANTIASKLHSLVDSETIYTDSLQIVSSGGLTLIKYSDIAIMSVTIQDAQLAGISKELLSEKYLKTIGDSLKKYREIKEKANLSWEMRILFTLLSLAGLILSLIVISRIFKWINVKLLAYEKKLKRKRKSILRYLIPTGPRNIFILISNIVKYLLLLLVVFLLLPFSFSFLPWTHGLVDKFYTSIAEPVTFIINGFIEFLPHLFFIVIIYYVARYIVKILSNLEEEYQNDSFKIKGFHKDWAKPTLNLIKIIVYAFALIFMFPHLPGSNSPAFQGVSIFFGVLLSLGSTSAIANIVAGLVITYMRPFQIGDRVRVDGTIGDVIEKTLLVTKIRTLKNENVTIPNATIINTHLWNYTKNASGLGLILHTSVTIGYDVDWKLVNKLLLEAAKNTKLLQKTPSPFVLQTSLDDYYVSYELNVYTKQPTKMAVIYSDLHANILESFNKSNVEILSPKYIAERSGEEITIPKTNNPVEEVIDKLSGKPKKKK